MGESSYKISVGLYLRGADIDPAQISKLLRKVPDRSQRRGERQSGAGGREYVRNIGLWALEAKVQPESSKVADYVDELLSRIDFDHTAISKVDGLEEAYIDIFMAREPDEGGGGTTEYEMTPSQMRELSRIGIPVRFTIAVVNAR